ncbi:MAG: hypothetical protein K6B41_09625 [Butyrivibrio sp.]|nr:hypothetical protein [Butyrivibrio sp.]
MDFKVFRLVVAVVVSMTCLIFVVVYATNSRKIGKLISENSSSDASTEMSSVEEEDTTGFGTQIGDNLKGFLTDENFWDETERIPSVVISSPDENIHSSLSDNDITDDSSLAGTSDSGDAKTDMAVEGFSGPGDKPVEGESLPEGPGEGSAQPELPPDAPVNGASMGNSGVSPAQ